MKKLYIDMDGSIAQFYESEQCLEAMYEEGFFRNLKPYSRIISALNLYVERNPETEVCILSAFPSSSFAKEEKEEWLNKFFPVSDRIFLEAGKNKAEVVGKVTENDFLLDDYTRNLLEWTEAGGKGIKVRNELNCLSGVWAGDTVSCFDDAETTAKKLEEIIGKEV